MSEQRYQAVMAVVGDGLSISQVAEKVGVSRQTLHAWLARYEAEGLDGLADRSHRPVSCPHQMPAVVEAAVLELRRSRGCPVDGAAVPGATARQLSTSGFPARHDSASPEIFSYPMRTRSSPITFNRILPPRSRCRTASWMCSRGYNRLVVNHRLRSSVLLLSKVMLERFAGTPSAKHWEGTP